MVLADLLTSFVLGLLTPLTAVCVLPLYPGFLSYLSSQVSSTNATNTTNSHTEKLVGADITNRNKLAMFGIVVTSGVVVFMTLLGLVFTTILEVSLTSVIGTVSPIAFGILAGVSLLLIFNVDFSEYIPRFSAPITKNPWYSAFLFGFFFGAIIVPCNPLFIAALFAKTSGGLEFASNVLNFFAFGLGIGFPLLIFSIVSSTASKSVIGFLTKNSELINRVSGVLMLIVSLYYLVYVFRILG